MITQTIAGVSIPELYETEVEYAANNVRGAIKYWTDTGSKYFGPGKKVYWPILPALPTANVKTNYPTVTYADPSTTTSSTATPAVVYTGLIIQEDVALTTVKDSVQLWSPPLAEALYQKLDVDGFSLHASFATGATDGGAWTYANFLLALGTLMEAGGDKVSLGDITGFYHIGHWNDIMAEANIISAQIRGESNGPAKTGVIDLTNGIRLFFTANVQISTTYRNMLTARKAIWVARKNRPKIEYERTDLVQKVMASHMYSIQVLHASLGIVHIVTTK